MTCTSVSLIEDDVGRVSMTGQVLSIGNDLFHNKFLPVLAEKGNVIRDLSLTKAVALKRETLDNEEKRELLEEEEKLFKDALDFNGVIEGDPLEVKKTAQDVLEFSSDATNVTVPDTQMLVDEETLEEVMMSKVAAEDAEETFLDVDSLIEAAKEARKKKVAEKAAKKKEKREEKKKKKQEENKKKQEQLQIGEARKSRTERESKREANERIEKQSGTKKKKVSCKKKFSFGFITQIAGCTRTCCRGKREGTYLGRADGQKRGAARKGVVEVSGCATGPRRSEGTGRR